ncbi:hypothetical protein M413DRAFT_25675 [Hebeloma cylindrosporum]|uniref:Uncharacterized protein n=1 Tax=Hebeloma cylindrosporum TaxID=76867 RepID=A0A0C2Y330_HEBCY|nr:hypothetical protein M413DRAFT_25675 [Hebeloma cylindrosporum h7]
MRLPKLDLHTNPKGRICFYGYDVSLDWLVEYAISNIKNNDEVDDAAALQTTAARIMRLRTRTKTLGMESALLNPRVPDDTALEYSEGVRMVRIISICTTESESYHKRPTQAQADKLSEIIGKQPRWWIDFESPSTYHE